MLCKNTRLDTLLDFKSVRRSFIICPVAEKIFHREQKWQLYGDVLLRTNILEGTGISAPSTTLADLFFCPNIPRSNTCPVLWLQQLLYFQALLSLILNISYIEFHRVTTSCFNFKSGRFICLWASCNFFNPWELLWKYSTIFFTCPITSLMWIIEFCTTKFRECAKHPNGLQPPRLNADVIFEALSLIIAVTLFEISKLGIIFFKKLHKLSPVCRSLNSSHGIKLDS